MLFVLQATKAVWRPGNEASVSSYMKIKHYNYMVLNISRIFDCTTDYSFGF